MEYYVFATKEAADTCIGYINGTEWFPIVGNRNGVPDPTAQMTTSWCLSPSEMLSGEWAVPRISTARLDYMNVPEEDRAEFMAVFGQDVRELTPADFVVIEEPEEL